MEEHSTGPTAHADVNAVLTDLLAGAQAVLGDRFIGLYLYGSLATGDFNPDQSDIDFLVVTRGDLPDEIIAGLETMHLELAQADTPGAAKLEGLYLPHYALPRHDPQDIPRPTLNEGRFYLAVPGSDWIIQRHILREHECAIAGPRLREAIDPVSPEDLRLAVREILYGWWAMILADESRLESPGYQPFAVLSMCRALYTLEHSSIVSKRQAARWAQSRLGPEWSDLIDWAVAWRWGEQSQRLEQTAALIRHTLDRSRELEPR